MAQNQKIGKVHTTTNTNEDGGSVQYHNTVVVEWTKNTIYLDSNGWKTNTTKLRMNQASNEYDLGFQVWQKNHQWFVDYKGKTLDFSDKMELER